MFERSSDILFGRGISRQLKEIEEEYNNLKERNVYLQKENDRLKSENYKDSELAAMKEKCEKMEKDLLRGFPISQEEQDAIVNWCWKHADTYENEHHTIDEYEFTPTEIGTFGTVRCTCGREFTFQEAK